MQQDALKRLIVESVAERGISAVKEDPKRSIRKLVDLGQEFAKGRFQKQFFQLCGHLLADEDSPYYHLLLAMARQVDTKRLRTFGVNLGWQSWTVGANQIRGIEASEGFQVPWSLMFHLGAADSFLSPEVFLRTLEEGKELGIYTIMADGEGCRELTPYLDIVRQQRDSAFLFLLKPKQAIQYENQIMACSNLMVSISADGHTGWESAGDLLRDDGVQLGFHLRYDRDTLQRWNGKAQNRAALEPFFQHGGICLFLLATESADAESVERVCRGVRDYRNQPSAPLFPIDFYTDCNYVYGIISDDVSFLGIRADGGINQCTEGREVPTELSLEGHTLRELLQLLYPKEPQNADK